jgi:hypothetical protein
VKPHLSRAPRRGTKRLVTARAALTGLALLSAGCTFEPGKGYATLESASFSLAFEPGAARDLGDDTVLTDRGFAVKVTELTLELGELTLSELGTSGGSDQSFDPANPPAGYSLCHGGHCHADDGRLVAYADIEAELAGGAAAFEPVVTLGTAGVFSALEDPTIDSVAVAPSRALPRVTLRKASLPLHRVLLKAEAQHASGVGPTASIEATLSPGPSLEHGFTQHVDRDGPERFRLKAELAIDGSLFDDIDFEQALAAGQTTWSVEGLEGARFLQNLAASTLKVSIR